MPAAAMNAASVQYGAPTSGAPPEAERTSETISASGSTANGSRTSNVRDDPSTPSSSPAISASNDVSPGSVRRSKDSTQRAG